MRILLILSIFIGGFASTSVTSLKENKDVLILATLIQDHLRKTDGRSISLAELIEKDTLKRISNSFERIDLRLKGGHISVCYKFSGQRDTRDIDLNDKEKELASRIRWTEKESKNQHNGEIRFDYGERFYRLLKIIVRKSDS